LDTFGRPVLGVGEKAIASRLILFMLDLLLRELAFYAALAVVAQPLL